MAIFQAITSDSESPSNTEAGARELFLPIQDFSLGCLYAELLLDTFLWYSTRV